MVQQYTVPTAGTSPGNPSTEQQSAATGGSGAITTDYGPADTGIGGVASGQGFTGTGQGFGSGIGQVGANAPAGSVVLANIPPSGSSTAPDPTNAETVINTLIGTTSNPAATQGISGWEGLTGAIASEDYALGNQFLADYESGTLPAGTQAAISQAYTSGEAALTSQLSSEGINPVGSTQYLGGMESLQQQQSIATQNALNELLQNAFQSQGISLQANGMLEQFQEFEQELMFQYAELAVQEQEFNEEQSQAGKGQAGSMAGSLGSMLGGLKSVVAAAIIGVSHGTAGWF